MVHYSSSRKIILLEKLTAAQHMKISATWIAEPDTPLQFPQQPATGLCAGPSEDVHIPSSSEPTFIFAP
jgi:hypothetical protein